MYLAEKKRNVVSCHLVMLMLVIGSFAVIISFTARNVSALSDTHTWDGLGANQLASTPENWVSDIAPEALDHILFTAASGFKNCTWDLALTMGDFTLETGFVGWVNHSTVNFGVRDLVLNGGKLNTPSTKYIVVSGNVSKNGAITVVGGNGANTGLALNMTGAGKSLAGTVAIIAWSLNFVDDTTIIGQVNAKKIAIGVGAIVTVSAASTFYWHNVEDTFSNAGEITGAGLFYISNHFQNANWNPGTISCSTIIYAIASSTGSRTLTFTGSGAMIHGSILLYSAHATNFMTLDLSASNHALNAIDITIGARGILNGRASQIDDSGNWDSYAGTFTEGLSTAIMTGTTKTIKTANTNAEFNNLQISGTIATLSSLNVTNNLTIDASKTLAMGSGKALMAGNLSIGSSGSLSLADHSYVLDEVVNDGAITQNGKRLNISGSSTIPLTGYGTFDGDVYLNGSLASSYAIQTGLPMGYLHTDRDTSMSVSSSQYLRAIPASTEFINVSINSYGSEAGCVARWTADSLGPVTYSLVASPNTLYDVWVDQNTRIGTYQTGPNGVVLFTYGGPFSSHEFVVSESGGPPSQLSAMFEYTVFGNTATFTDKSYGGAISWLWSFGDGTGSTGQNPTHRYYSSGEYAVSLTIFDSEGRSSNAKTTITIELGPEFPIERTDEGWNLYISEELTISLPAIALSIVGVWVLVSSYFPMLLPLLTPRFRRIVGLVIVGVAGYWFIFVDNKWV